IGALFGTGLLGAALVALGAIFFILPGLVLAVGFSMAPPLVILEGVSGRVALERSWRLLRGHWAQALLLCPFPLAGLVLLYRDASQYMRRISAPG
ncbi:MAG TPA: hypothetical protein VE755_01170, partial [Myxococcales bacterium]|nr:hypothetical protein [Myxococcales bacterium]